jgi:hypothetical protein
MPGAPEGLAVDDPDGILAVGLRGPDGVALVNVMTGRVRMLVRLPGAPRHLQLAGPAGPVLVPAEQVGQLFQIACCTPYGIAIDGRRSLVYVTLTATNRLESFRISGDGLVPDRIWPTVRGSGVNPMLEWGIFRMA